MFTILFSILLLVSILSIFSNLVMRIRLTKVERSRDKLVWWRRGSDEVTSVYGELFPSSHLPLISEIAFWLVLAAAIVVLIFSRWKSH